MPLFPNLLHLRACLLPTVYPLGGTLAFLLPARDHLGGTARRLPSPAVTELECVMLRLHSQEGVDQSFEHWRRKVLDC